MTDVISWLRDADAVAAATADQIRERLQEVQAAQREAEDAIVRAGRLRERLLLEPDTDDKIFALDREIQTHSLRVERLEIAEPMVKQALDARIAADALAERRKARFGFLDALIQYRGEYIAFAERGRQMRAAYAAVSRHLDGIDEAHIVSE